MDLLQLSPYVIHPPQTGGDHRTHGLVKEFPKLGSGVIRFCQGSAPDRYLNLDFRRKVQVEDRYLEYRHLNPIHDLVMAPVLMGYPNLFAGDSLQWASGPLDEYIESSDILLVREPWQFSAVQRETEKPIVYSSHNVETDRFKSTLSLPFSGWAISKIQELERQAVQNSQMVICTSKRDADRYQELFSPDTPIRVLPNGTYEADIRKHRPNSDGATELRQRYEIDASTTVCVFVGSAYKPNVEAAAKILKIADKLSGSRQDLHFLIVGSVGNSIDSSLPNVTITGFVDNFEDHMDMANIALNPMISGGGTNIKVLDYFARSLPVITTPFGLRGINASDHESIIVAETDQFVEAIVSLANDKDRRKYIGKEARKLVKRKYTWERSSRSLHTYLTNLVQIK